MAAISQRNGFRAVVAIACLGATLLALPAPASAGFLDRLFGGLQRAIEGPRSAPPPAFVDPFTSLSNHVNRRGGEERLRADTNHGPSKAFCVRSCDGRFFPVQGHASMSAAETCRAFCPASETRLYAGSNIDYATTKDGSRYADLPNAFVYRKQLVAGCTCNGRTAFGLANIAAATDPTLRSGDIVATETGLMAFTGKGSDKTNGGNFTPVADYSRLSKSARATLADTKVAPPSPPTGDVTSSIPPEALNARAEAVR